MSESLAAVSGYTIKSLNESKDFSELPDGLWKEKGIEGLVIPEKDGKTAHFWWRCIVVSMGRGIPFAYREDELQYKIGDNLWTNKKPEGWDDENNKDIR